MEEVLVTDYTREEGVPVAVREALELSLREESTELRRVYLHVNASRPDPYQSIRGAVYNYDPEARLMTPDPFCYTWCGNILAVKLKDPPGGFTDAHFLNQEDKLSEGVPEHVSREREPQLESAIVDHGRVVDQCAWSAALGNHGFVGVFRQERDRIRGADDYWLVVHSAAPDRMAYEFFKKIENAPPGTIAIGNIGEWDEYRIMHDISRRNAHRLLYNAARSLDVENALPCRPISDLQAKTRASHVARPFLALPFASVEYNVLRNISIVTDEDERRLETTAYYSHCCPTYTAQKMFIFLHSPEFGVWLIPPPKQDRTSVGLCCNAALNSFPVGMPRRDPFPGKQEGVRTNHLFWDGKESGIDHPKAGGVYEQFAESDAEPLNELSGVDVLKKRLDLRPVVVRMSNYVEPFE